MTDLFGNSALTHGAPTGLGTAMAGGKGKLSGDTTPRRDHDYYPTPPLATHALLSEEYRWIDDGRPIWEPCGRGGAIINVLQERGYQTLASDIVGDPTHDVIERDLFDIKKPMAGQVITNPPFALSAQMIVHLLDTLNVDYCAMLLKATYWHAGPSRAPLFQRFKPARIYALTWRLDFIGGGAPVMECIWVVWDRSVPAISPTTYNILTKPGSELAVADLFD